jgi:uncharacterized protein
MSRIYRLFPTFLIPLLVCAPLSVGADTQRQLQRAQKTLAKGDYATAYAQFQQIDHPLAEFNTALMLDLGLGRPPDRAEACRWYEKAAKGNIPTGLVRHAECLADGVRDAPDPAQAAAWYARALEQGHLQAGCALGQLHMLGQGVPMDKPRGLELCTEAARAGSPRAMLQLARWFSGEDGAIRDEQQALRWYHAAATEQIAKAQHALGMMVLAGRVEELAPPQALGWLEAAATQGYAASYLPLAVIYWHHRSDAFPDSPPAQDLAKAYLWASAAREGAPDETTREEAATLVGQIDALMPGTWKAELDEKVRAHLADSQAGSGSSQ